MKQTTDKQKIKKFEQKAWLVRGRTSRRVAALLAKPMTSTEVALALVNDIPTIERAQVTRILHRLRDEDLVYCVNAHANFDRQYKLTTKGMTSFQNISPSSNNTKHLHEEFDWRTLSYLLKYEVARRILVSMHEHIQDGAISGNAIRRWISRKHPVNFLVFYRNMSKLVTAKLVQYVGASLIGKHRMYILTERGQTITERLTEET